MTMAKNVTLTFKWFGPWLVCLVNGELGRCWHHSDLEELVGRTREPPPTPLEDSDSGEIAEP